MSAGSGVCGRCPGPPVGAVRAEDRLRSHRPRGPTCRPSPACPLSSLTPSGEPTGARCFPARRRGLCSLEAEARAVRAAQAAAGEGTAYPALLPFPASPLPPLPNRSTKRASRSATPVPRWGAVAKQAVRTSSFPEEVSRVRRTPVAPAPSSHPFFAPASALLHLLSFLLTGSLLGVSTFRTTRASAWCVWNSFLRKKKAPFWPAGSCWPAPSLRIPA